MTDEDTPYTASDFRNKYIGDALDMFYWLAVSRTEWYINRPTLQMTLEEESNESE